MAIACDGPRGRIYLSPDSLAESIAKSAIPTWRPENPCRGTFASNAQGRSYGFKVFGDYFTPRQLVALTTFSDLILDVREKIRLDAIADLNLTSGQYKGQHRIEGISESTGPTGSRRRRRTPDISAPGRENSLQHKGFVPLESQPGCGDLVA